MSSTLKSIVGRRADQDVEVTAYSGGAAGQCLQLAQGSPLDAHIVHLDKAQVVEMVEAMQAFLAR